MNEQMIKSRPTIVFCTDTRERPIAWLEVAIKSIRHVFGHSVRVVVCADGVVALDDVDIEIVDARPYISKYDLNRVSVCEFHGDKVSPMMFFRLVLPLVDELKAYDLVVYVDTDVEFESDRFLDIFNEDMESYDLAGVQTCLNDPVVARDNIEGVISNGGYDDPLVPEASKIRMSEHNVSVASGMLLMNLNRMRVAHGDYEEYLRHMISRYVECKFRQNDESLINLYLDCKTVSASFNAWSSVVKVGEPVYLRHYPGGRKVFKKFYPEREAYVPSETVDIVYTAGVESEHEDQELRWSLRSIAKYGMNIGRVIVTSPVERDWLSDDVIQVDCQDIPNAGYKHHNILWSILGTIDVLDLHGEFLVSSDDHFYVRETDFARYPFNVRGWCIPNYAEDARNDTNQWKKSCVDTYKFLKDHNLPTVNFQAHANSHWNADLVRDERALFIEAMKLPYCVEPHVLMQNLWLSRQPGLPVKYRQDAKILEFRGTSGLDCISCYDQTFVDQPFLDFMNSEFGEKCRYER